MQMAQDCYDMDGVKDLCRAMAVQRDEQLDRLKAKIATAETVEDFARELAAHVSYEELLQAMELDGTSSDAIRAVHEAIAIHENRILEGSLAISDAMERSGSRVGPPAEQLATGDGWDL